MAMKCVRDCVGPEPRSSLGTWFLLYLPGLLLLGLSFALLAPHHGWSLAGLHLVAAAYTIYGGAEKYCVRQVMAASVPVRLCVAAVLLGGRWKSSGGTSIDPMTGEDDGSRDGGGGGGGGGGAYYFLYIWAGIELLTATPALWHMVQETIPPPLQQKLDRRTTADGALAASVRLPSHTRAVVCVTALIEALLGVLGLYQPRSISWFVPLGASAADDGDAYEAMRAYGLASAANAVVILIAVGVLSVAAMKWWCATYHLLIASSLLPLRVLLGLHLSTTWLYGVVHFIFGVLLALMPSTSVVSGGERRDRTSAVKTTVKTKVTLSQGALDTMLNETVRNRKK
jgi:hypothetical protein